MNAGTMRRFSTADVVDVVVIGTGAGGAPVMATLAEAGLSVVALEAGRWWNPADEYAADEVKMSELYWLDERISAGETPTAFGGNNSGTGVGGSMLHWGAYAPRADERDLKLRTDSGVGVDFPLTYAELVPLYEELETFMGVSGPSPYPWDPARRYPLGPIALNAPAQAMEKGFAALGIKTSPAPVAAVSARYTQPGYAERQPCVGCGFCHQGCVFHGAKGSLDVTWLPRALAAGAEIRANSFVHAIERNAHGAIDAVVYRREGEDIRQRCKAVFLCAGAIETPRLLLHTGLANASGQVGRNFMAHVSPQVWGTFEPEMRMNKGFPASLITEEMMRPPDADFAGGYLVQPLGVVPVTFASQTARGRGLWGPALVEYLDQYNHIAGIGINGDCLPYEGNFLELSGEADPRDGLGIPKPLIHFSYGENERRMSEHGAKLMTAAWQAAGARDIWTFQRSAHVIGTCRMGEDAATSVVDPYGRSHEIPNLWISDNSTFPAALAANPALTIMALALRSARHFLATAAS